MQWHQYRAGDGLVADRRSSYLDGPRMCSWMSPQRDNPHLAGVSIREQLEARTRAARGPREAAAPADIIAGDPRSWRCGGRWHSLEGGRSPSRAMAGGLLHRSGSGSCRGGRSTGPSPRARRGVRRCHREGGLRRAGQRPVHRRRPSRHADRAHRTLDQLALATLLESGRYDRPLRRMREVYAGRRAALVQALHDRAPRHRRWP